MTRNERKKASKRRAANRLERAQAMASASINLEVRAKVRKNKASPLSPAQALEARAWKGQSCPIFREITKDKPVKPMSANELTAYQARLLG